MPPQGSGSLQSTFRCLPGHGEPFLELFDNKPMFQAVSDTSVPENHSVCLELSICATLLCKLVDDSLLK